jgi:hypothetical protein
VLRRFVIELSSGSPDYRAMGSVLGSAVRDNLSALRTRFTGLGALQSISFVRVDQAGNDVYVSRFANGALKWTITLGENDVLTAATMKEEP